MVHALCTPLAFSARHLQAYIILSLQGFLLCWAEHQSLSTCLSFLQTLMMGLATMYMFPSSRSVGLHRANIAPAMVDGGGSVTLTRKYEAGDPMLFSQWVIENVPRDLDTSKSNNGISLSQSLPCLHAIISDHMLSSDPVFSQRMPFLSIQKPVA